MGKCDRDPWFVFRDLPCLSCGYNLKTKQGPMVSCPECGHENDLAKPEQWKPQFPDGSGFDYPNLIALCLSLWIFPLLLAAICIELISDPGEYRAWLALLLYGSFSYKITILISEGIRKQLIVGFSAPRMIAMLSLATLVTCSPVLAGAIAYLLGLLLTWYWPIFIAGGFGASIFAYRLGTKLFPEENLKEGIPPWHRYCEAIITQFKKQKGE